MECSNCGKTLNPAGHGDLVCDGQVFCDRCHRYDRRLLEPGSLADLARWNQRLCQAFGCEPPLLAMGEPPPAGPFDFLADKKILMAEAHHRAAVIVFYPAGLRLATLCHELAHLMTGQDHTEAWARTFARLVAWVRQELPPDHYTAGMRASLLRPPQED
jgi:hypothetical protein